MRAKTVAITKITDPVIAKKIEDATRGLIPSPLMLGVLVTAIQNIL